MHKSSKEEKKNINEKQNTKKNSQNNKKNNKKNFNVKKPKFLNQEEFNKTLKGFCQLNLNKIPKNLDLIKFYTSRETFNNF